MGSLVGHRGGACRYAYRRFAQKVTPAKQVPTPQILSLMPSPTASKRSTNLAAAESAKTQMNSALSAAGHSADLIAKIVPTGFAVVVEKNPTSALTDEAAKTLANDTIGIEFYEE